MVDDDDMVVVVVVGLGRRVRQCRPFHLYRRGGRRAPWG